MESLIICLYHIIVISISIFNNILDAIFLSHLNLIKLYFQYWKFSQFKSSFWFNLIKIIKTLYSNPQQIQMESKDKITTMDDLPVIDLSQYMGQDVKSDQVKYLCNQVAESLHQNGILIIKDPRVDEHDNDEYIDMMEKYFQSRGA
jgi:hypothetical protein